MSAVIAGFAVVLFCAWFNKKAMGWLEWSRQREIRVRAEIAEMQREIDIH